MATPGTLPAAPSAPDRPRPDVLAYPSPTTSRYLIFLAALLSAGLFVGNWIHNQVLWEEWISEAIRCRQETLQLTPTQPGLEGAIARENAAAQCRADADRRRAAFAFGGAATAGVVGLIVLCLIPGMVERRRRLRPVPSGLAPASDRLATLAAEAGLARPPALMLGASGQRDGFSYGVPGRYRIALPQAVAIRWRSPTLFDPLVHHELAHVAHRDVALAWLARSVWYALAPLLAAPVVIALLSDDRSLLPDYLWRAALFAVVVQLVSSALLRSREHDADLRAAQAIGGPEAVAAVVAQARVTGQGSWHRGLLANHPTPARRLAVLERPELAAEVTFLDGFTAAFLATLTAPLVVFALVALLMGSGRSDLGQVGAALVAGPLLGGSVGLGLWRASLVRRVAGGAVRPAPVAFGVAAGLVLGQVVSLAQTGSDRLGGVTHPPMLAVIAVAGLGATALTAGLGELWADAAPALRRARASWLTALAASSVAFAAVLWAAGSLELAQDNLGWLVVRMWLVTVLGSWPVLVAVAALAATAAWALRRSGPAALTPRWLLERGEPGPWPERGRVRLPEVAAAALAAGLAGAGVIIGFRMLAGPVSGEAGLQRFYAYAWVAAAAGAAVVLALALLVPRRGVGVGALAGPLATLIAVAGFLAMNTALGGGLGGDFVTSAIRTPLALGLVLALVAAPAGLVTWQRDRQRRAWVWPVAAVLALVVATAAIGGRNLLVGDLSLAAPDSGEVDQQLARAEAAQYAGTALDVQRRYAAVEAAVATIVNAPTADGPARAARIRAEVVAPLRSLLADAEAYQPPTATVRSVHLACVAFLRAMVEAFETYATGFETDDAAAFAAAEAKLDEGRRHAGTWQAGLASMLAAAGMSTGAPGQQGNAPAVPTTTAPAAPATELTSNARAEASATAPASVDDAGNPVDYDPANVLDADPSTAWRVEGTGQGEMVAIGLPAPAHITEVGLIPGYAKSDPSTGKDRFAENRRIREVRWHFDDGTVVDQRFQDQPTMQQIAVEVTASRIVVEILATRPGDPDHDYTPISDISIVGSS